jgi:thiamine-phosphate pyrophosphorylase
MVISPGDGRPLRELLTWIELLGEAGAPGLLLREPGRPLKALSDALARALASFPFVSVHERCGMPGAQTTRAHAIHLMSSSKPDQSNPFGQSCHTRDQLDQAFSAGAAYAFLSPVLTPNSKPDDSRAPIGVAGYLEITTGRAALALGGISGARYREIRAKNGYGAAALGDFSRVSSPRDAKAKLAEYV